MISRHNLTTTLYSSSLFYKLFAAIKANTAVHNWAQGSPNYPIKKCTYLTIYQNSRHKDGKHVWENNRGRLCCGSEL